MKTKRLIFSTLNEKDYQDIRNLYADTQVRRYLGGPLLATAFEDRFKQFTQALAPEYYWAVRIKDDNQFLGLFCITKHHDKKNFEVSFQVKAEHWNQGYGTEALTALIEYAAAELEITKLLAETQAKNLASINLLESVGLHFVKKVERFGETQLIYST